MLGNVLSKNTTVHFLLYILLLFQFFHREQKLLWQIKDSRTFWAPPPIRKWGPRPLPWAGWALGWRKGSCAWSSSLRFPHPEPRSICLGSSWHAGTTLQLGRGSRWRGPEAPPTVLAELGADVSAPGQTRGPSPAHPLAQLSGPRQTRSLTRRAHAASPNCRFTGKTNDCWKPLRFKVSYNAARDNQKN